MFFENPYTLRMDDNDGKDAMRYFVTFTDGQGIHRETEVSCRVFKEFLRYVKVDRNQLRWRQRRIDNSDLADESTYRKMKNPPKSLEDTVFDGERDEHLRKAIAELPEPQRRRFVLYHEFGLTYAQIGEMEGRHFTSIRESVCGAEERIKKIIKKFES